MQVLTEKKKKQTYKGIHMGKRMKEQNVTEPPSPYDKRVASVAFLFSFILF
jgi:hypothetical protein